MSAPIGPGDFVECVDLAAPPWAFARPFRVLDVVDDDDCSDCGDQSPGVELDHPKCVGYVYCLGCQVRPIYRPRADLIESLKAPPITAPIRQSEPA